MDKFNCKNLNAIDALLRGRFRTRKKNTLLSAGDKGICMKQKY